MYRYILRKFIASVITLFVVVVLVYFVYVSIKPNPITAPADQKDMPAYIAKLNKFSKRGCQWLNTTITNPIIKCFSTKKVMIISTFIQTKLS